MRQRQRGKFGAALDGLYLACGWLAGLMLIVVCALMLILSAGREVSFNLRGGDEFAAWATAAMFALGLAHTFREGAMVRVGLLIERFEGRARLVAETVCLALGCVATGALAWFTVDLVWDSYRFNERAQGVVPVAMWLPQSALALGMIVQFIAFLDQFVGCLRGALPAYALPAPKTAAEVLERAASSL